MFYIGVWCSDGLVCNGRSEMLFMTPSWWHRNPPISGGRRVAEDSTVALERAQGVNLAALDRASWLAAERLNQK